MEKISGILPSSARIKNVDLNGGGAARPGSPSFGRTPGVSSLGQRPKFDGMVFGQLNRQQLQDARSQLDRSSKIAEDLADSFFMNSRIRAEEDRQEILQNPTEPVDWGGGLPIVTQESGIEDSSAVASPVVEVTPEETPVYDSTPHSEEVSGSEDDPQVGRFVDVAA